MPNDEICVCHGRKRVLRDRHTHAPNAPTPSSRVPLPRAACCVADPSRGHPTEPPFSTTLDTPSMGHHRGPGDRLGHQAGSAAEHKAMGGVPWQRRPPPPLSSVVTSEQRIIELQVGVVALFDVVCTIANASPSHTMRCTPGGGREQHQKQSPGCTPNADAFVSFAGRHSQPGE